MIESVIEENDNVIKERWQEYFGQFGLSPDTFMHRPVMALWQVMLFLSGKGLRLQQSSSSTISIFPIQEFIGLSLMRISALRGCFILPVSATGHPLKIQSATSIKRKR